MEKDFTTSWKSSIHQRKQRKFRYLAPLHIRQKFVSAHLSKELRKKHKCRNMSVKKNDKVIIMRGKFKKKTGKVERVDLKRSKIFINGIERTKKDGSKALIPIEPSNVMIIEMNLDDKRRQKIINRKNKKTMPNNTSGDNQNKPKSSDIKAGE